MEIKHLNKSQMLEYINWTYEDPFYNFKDEYKDSVLEEIEKDHDAYYGLFEGNTLLGIYEYHLHNDQMELGAAMNPAYIDQGHGKDFMVRCMSFARTQYHFHGSFFLEVASHNQKAIHLYESLGFRIKSKREAISYNRPVTFMQYVKKPLENIVFDNGNVLTTFSPSLLVHHYFQSDHELVQEVVFSKIWADLDQGIITEEEAMHYYKDHLPERLHQNLKDMFASWHLHLTPKQEMYELMVENYGKYHYYLLSNAPVRHKVFKENIPALKMMEGEVVSYRLKINKPDPRIYQELIEKYHLDPEKTVMIDDKQENIDEAIHQGMYGFVYHDNINELKEYLMYLGV